MTRQEAVAILENLAESFTGDLVRLPKGTPGLDAAWRTVKAIDMAQEALRQETGWISVEDRMPEDLKTVLCWYEYFRYGSHNRRDKTYGLSFVYEGQWMGDVANSVNPRVLYWMPLPEPLEEVKHD